MGQRRAILAVAMLLLGAGCDRTASNRPPEQRGVSGAHLILPAVSGRPGVLYFVLQSDPRFASAADVQRLRGVSVDGAKRAEIHQSMSHGGMSVMRPLASVPLRNGPNRFCPNGLHVMLFDLDPKLKPGGSAAVRLDFGGNKALNAQAAVLAFGQKPARDEPFDCTTKV